MNQGSCSRYDFCLKHAGNLSKHDDNKSEGCLLFGVIFDIGQKRPKKSTTFAAPTIIYGRDALWMDLASQAVFALRLITYWFSLLGSFRILRWPAPQHPYFCASSAAAAPLLVKMRTLSATWAAKMSCNAARSTFEGLEAEAQPIILRLIADNSVDSWY